MRLRFVILAKGDRKSIYREGFQRKNMKNAGLFKMRAGEIGVFSLSAVNYSRMSRTMVILLILRQAEDKREFTHAYRGILWSVRL